MNNTAVEQVLDDVERMLLRLSAAERGRAVAVLRRRLAHPEFSSPGNIGAYRDPGPSRGAGWVPSTCVVCGLTKSGHDTMTGESDICDGYVPGG